MTHEELAQAEALCEAATPGPWDVWEGPAFIGGGTDICIGAGDAWLVNMDHRYCRKITNAVLDRTCDPNRLTCDICHIDADKITEEQRANSVLIAAARTLVPALIAEVRRLQATEYPSFKTMWELEKKHSTSLCEELGQLRERLAYAEADVTRLDWLEKSGGGRPWAIISGYTTSPSVSTVREAIDAAIAGETS